MFKLSGNYKYIPILSISPSEMAALKELPVKDKNILLPVFPIKSWATAYKLINSLEKIESSIGKDNLWIADIDYFDLSVRNKESFREVHHEISALTDSNNGYRNWCNFVSENKNIVPCIQFGDISQLEMQVRALYSLGRGVVLILKQIDITSGIFMKIVHSLRGIDDLLVILDLEQITAEEFNLSHKIKDLLLTIRGFLPLCSLALSSTSFPDSFGGYHKSSNTIYERALYDRVRLDIPDLIYSDRGSARAFKQSGGAGTPPPRIDYACRNEWHFIRREFSNSSPALVGDEKKGALKQEKQRLYTEIALEVMSQAYWEDELALYANYLIELTAKGERYGIDSAQKSTAVRINKHLHTQLYYDVSEESQDTDDDWVD